MHKTVLLAIVFLCSPNLPAEQPDWAKVHTETIRGIDQLYNLEFEAAVSTFDGVIRLAPNDPRGHFFKATVDYWIFMFSKDQQAYDRFFSLSDTLIHLCEAALENNKEDWKAKFYLGGIYGFRGLMHQRNNSILKAVWDGKKGYNRLEECALNKPDLVDAQMGFGLFTYLVGKIPRSFRWVVNLIGFSGDIEGGLAYLRNAADKGVYTRSEASFYLSQFLYFEGKTEEAFGYLNRLLKKYPDNTLFLLTYGAWQSRTSNIDSALIAAERAIEINNRKGLKYGDEIAYDVLGQCYWIKNDYARARDAIEQYIHKSENKENIRNALFYRLGLCNELLGDRARALEAYARVKPVTDKDRGGEIYTHKKARERIAAPMAAGDKLLIRAANERNLKHYDRALALYAEATASNPADLELRALALYGMQQTHHDAEHYEKALEIHRQLVALRPITEAWIIPHSYFQAGHTYLKMNRNQEARTAFERVDDFDDYDFERGLEDRADNELKKL